MSSMRPLHTWKFHEYYCNTSREPFSLSVSFVDDAVLIAADMAEVVVYHLLRLLCQSLFAASSTSDADL